MFVLKDTTKKMVPVLNVMTDVKFVWMEIVVCHVWIILEIIIEKMNLETFVLV